MVKGVETEGGVEDPLAAEGNLCIYQGRTEEPEGTRSLRVTQILRPGAGSEGPAEAVPGAGTSGAAVSVHYRAPSSGTTEAAVLNGSWAVTAPKEP